MRVLSWKLSDRFGGVYAELQNRCPWLIRFHSDPHLEMLAVLKVPRPDREAEFVDLDMHPGLSQQAAEILALHELGHLHLLLLGYPGVWQRRTGKVARYLSGNLTNLIHHPLIRPWAEARGFDYTPELDSLADSYKNRPDLALFVEAKHPAEYAANLFAYAGQYLEYHQSERSQVKFPYKLPRDFGAMWMH